MLKNLANSQSFREVELRWRQILRHGSYIYSAGALKKANTTRIRTLISLTMHAEDRDQLQVGFKKTLGALNRLKLKFGSEESIARQCVNMESKVQFIRDLSCNPQALEVHLQTHFNRLKPVINSILKDTKTLDEIFQVFVTNQPIQQVKNANAICLLVRLALIYQTDSFFKLYFQAIEDPLIVQGVQTRQNLLQQASFCLIVSIKRDFQGDTLSHDRLDFYNDVLVKLLKGATDEDFVAKSLTNILAYIHFVKASRMISSVSMDQVLKELILDRKIATSFDCTKFNNYDLAKLGRCLSILSSNTVNQDSIDTLFSVLQFHVKAVGSASNLNERECKRIFDIICTLAPVLNNEEKESALANIKSLLFHFDEQPADRVTPSLAIKASLLLGFTDESVDILHSYKATQNVQSVNHLLDFFLENDNHERVLSLSQSMQELAIPPTSTTIDKIGVSFFKQAIIAEDSGKVLEGIGFIISLSKMFNVKISTLTKERVEYVTEEFEMKEVYNQFLYDASFRYHLDEVDEDFYN